MAETADIFARGTFEFEVTASGDLSNSATNVETLRRLWLHHALITGDDLGPGDRGDFDQGAWHVACHLAGAGGVRRSPQGALLWLEISHRLPADEYFASVTTKVGGHPVTTPIDTADGRRLLRASTLLGFVEGNSLGRTSARGMNDAPTLFNLWRRQDFDQEPEHAVDGGKVWEHWCTLRDIRPSARLGTSVLSAYVSLVAALGDRFPAAVARGRTDYGHPRQLAAMVQAGFIAKESALWNTKPLPIPAPAEALLNEASPAACLEAVEVMPWGKQPRYYMFRRKIKSWCTLPRVRKELKDFTQ
jgi:hypothetical protein